MAFASATASGKPIPAAPAMTREEKKVIFASSLGTVFEWYDFYLYGSLAAIIAKQFFSGARSDVGASSSRCSPSPPASWCARSARWCSAASATWSAASTPSWSPS